MAITIGVVGLGKMGSAVVYRLLQAHYTVFGYDSDKEARENIKKLGADVCDSLEEIAKKASIIWLMVPAKVVDNVVASLFQCLPAHRIIIDGGNSHFLDSINRARKAKDHNLAYLDCGTSGGLAGRDHGFCLMIGGDNQIFLRIEEIFNSIAAPHGYAYIGPSGSGHYVKMIHNGIEYAVLQAYAEGFNILKNGEYPDLDLHSVAHLWNHASVIRSYILELCTHIFKNDQSFSNVRGEIQEGGTGAWTVQEAHKQNIPASVIEEALNVRRWSQKTGGNYATKLVALLRHEFGGHPVKKIRNQ